jgi:hypothetical protein
MINIRKLAAVDMALHGTRFILGEFAVGIVLPLILGLISIRAGLFGDARVAREIVLGLWMIGVSANYIPLFIYAVLIARSGTVKEEGQPELANVKRYTVQQVIIFIPFFVPILAVLQECSRRRS